MEIELKMNKSRRDENKALKEKLDIIRRIAVKNDKTIIKDTN